MIDKQYSHSYITPSSNNNAYDQYYFQDSPINSGQEYIVDDNNNAFPIYINSPSNIIDNDNENFIDNNSYNEITNLAFTNNPENSVANYNDLKYTKSEDLNSIFNNNNDIFYDSSNNNIFDNDQNNPYYYSLPNEECIQKQYYYDNYQNDYPNNVNDCIDNGINDLLTNLSSNKGFALEPTIEKIERRYQTVPLTPHVMKSPTLYNQNSINNDKAKTVKIMNNKQISNNKIKLIQNNKEINQNNHKRSNTNIGNNIDEQKASILPPKQIKRKPLKRQDFINIIYKEIGIINLGNTCFINSCLQVLIHCPNFIYKFFEKILSLSQKNPQIFNEKDTPISYHFFGVCNAMMDTINTNDNYIDITYFKNAFGKKHSTFGGYAQNDSQEFCRVLLEDISTELNEVKTKGLYKLLSTSDKKTKSERDKEFDLNFQEREKSIITDLFYAQIINTFICECKSITYSFQKILDFPLLLPNNTSNIDPNIDIIDLLKNYFKTETIDFEIKCEKCHKVLKHTKEIKISRPPEILILSLQRVDQTTQTKNECIVKFPPILDMSEFIDKECGFGNEPLYDLFAIVNHTGNMDYGHYYSYIKFKNQENFYEFNDSTVLNIGKETTIFPCAYILFYIKKKNK